MHADVTVSLQSGLVSVVIPCYNAERFLADTLQSVFKQSYPHLEIVIVDDGSTDGSTELIRSFDNRVRAVFGPNLGASAARNRGTALARGEFIQYLDADDLLVPDAIERRIQAIHVAGADVAYSDWENLVELEPGRFQIGSRVARRIEDLDKDLAVAKLKFWAPPAALTYRRSIVDKIGGWKEWLPVIQDARFLQDAGLLGGRFVHVPSVGALYRVHLGNSLSRRSGAAFVADVYRNGCDLQSIIEGKGELNGEMRRALAEIYDYVARALFIQDHASFHECVKRLYQLEPGFRLTRPKVAFLMASVFGFHMASALLSLLDKARRV